MNKITDNYNSTEHDTTKWKPNEMPNKWADIPEQLKWKTPKLEPEELNVDIGDKVFILKKPVPSNMGYDIDLDTYYHAEPGTITEINGKTVTAYVMHAGMITVGENRIRIPNIKYDKASKEELKKLQNNKKKKVKSLEGLHELKEPKEANLEKSRNRPTCTV